MPYPKHGQIVLIPDPRWRSPTALLGRGEMLSGTKIIHVVDGCGEGLPQEEMVITSLKLVGELPRPSVRCRGCGAPFESTCSYCGAVNARKEAELVVWYEGDVRPLPESVATWDIDARYAPLTLQRHRELGRFALASLTPEPLKLKIAIPLARWDKVSFWAEPAMNADLLVYYTMCRSVE